MSAINKENYQLFTYTNENLLTGTPRGICIEFHGLNLTGPYWEPEERAKKFADAGVILVKPMTNPWSWMNPQAFEITERIVEILGEKYPNVDKNLCVAGGSMGGYESLMYSVYTDRKLLSCTVNCPLCDCEIFEQDDPWRAKTIKEAFYNEGDFAKSLSVHSPINRISDMPDIPYYVFQCTGDQIIKKDHQSDPFVEKAKASHNVTYFISETPEHCELSPELWIKYDECILSSFDN